ncbi:unnamed protein product [Caretta caretta]
MSLVMLSDKSPGPIGSCRYQTLLPLPKAEHLPKTTLCERSMQQGSVQPRPEGHVYVKINQGTKGYTAKTFLNGLYTNVTSLGVKQEEMDLLIYESKFDLVGIIETWCNESHY